ncbi:biopolymer transporter ExbD [Thermosynechococcus sp. QKsg1]|uniref:ExbD/TolR family protein n=1 Tax=unclassified Thermosynechococcus TaxID=2622553 RepID=UPI00122DDB20|nr:MULTISPECIES: biopolymer transporter ExbD [unclassified Thermosynechococcus]QEQ00406.1 biopolymer transporter ExbD [Thermosynechococcus sp. CL-1]WJI24628.1 biopolymer transporter ExbD [Thermosynechococcus sp. B0]WJI29673.1 biopolymer transporter ExbD [Thermosynechococcus sp. B3]WKT84261.1 biopolymer transporter ExbD [Thermosynechococcus sp. HY596]WNC63395.1 biopolymer transporter ExbD [Thermosynechococcus sp. HY591]
MAVKIHLPSESENARIEMLPLIDVVFCILTFFILAAVSLTRQQAITLNLPQASTSQAQSQKMLVVSIDPAGQLFVDKDPVNRSELYERLATYLKTNPQGVVILRASQVVSYNEVIQVLDLLRSVGGNRVALATQPVEQPVLRTETRPNPLPSPPANDQPTPSNP